MRRLRYVRLPTGGKNCQSGSADWLHKLQLRMAALKNNAFGPGRVNIRE